jgi:hypothetical protein
MLTYCDSTVCEFHAQNQNLPITTDISDADITQAIFHVPFPWKGGYGVEQQKRIDQLYKQCDKIIVLCSELHNVTVQFLTTLDRPKIHWFISGYINPPRLPEHATVNQWMDWFDVTVKHYRQHPEFLDGLTPFKSKVKHFDILLGQPRLHRDMIYYWIDANQRHQDVVMTYIRDFNLGLYDHDFHSQSLQSRSATDFILEEPGLEYPSDDMFFTIDRVKYHGHEMSLSQVIPKSIYNQTAYSIVAETNYMNAYSFMTEKIVKPILAQRLFLVFAGQHYLHNLRNLGFKTFDGIIDESYDNEPNMEERYRKIYDQLNYLFNTPQHQILRAIKPIVEHNKQVMLETDWHGKFNSMLALTVHKDL